jgi:hypothetical protein
MIDVMKKKQRKRLRRMSFQNRRYRSSLWWTTETAGHKPGKTPWAIELSDAALKILDARRTSEQRSAWLLEFIQRDDLARIDDDGVRELQTQIAGFCLEEQNASGPGIILHAEHYSVFSARKLAAVAEKLRTEIGEALTGGRWWTLKPANLSRSIYRDDRTGGGAESIDSNDAETVLLWGAQTLIRNHLERILRCRECSRWFIKIRRQLFCSYRCAHRVAAREWEKSNPKLVSAIRHRSYVKSVAKTNPAKAKKIRRVGPR